MTSPDGASPDGAIAIGMFAARQAETEEQAAARATDGAWKNSWNNAQSEHQRSTAGMYREVTRLDNRIDTFLYGNDLVSFAVYSESDVWNKPAGAVNVSVSVIAGSSGGGRANNPESGGDFARGGLGGWSGGWSRGSFSASDLPDQVEIIVGSGSEGGTTVGAAAADAGESGFGTFVTASGAEGTNYGSGDYSFRSRGGKGSWIRGNRFFGWTYIAASYGGDGSFHPGGEAGSPTTSGNPGVNGYSITEFGKIGMGSGGGGGASRSDAGSGGRGGDGGWPAGAGGGGGASNLGSSGNGGNGASGAVFVITTLEDKLGIPPSPPTDVAVVSVTSTSVTVSWTASTDDIAVRRYEVFLDGIAFDSFDGIEADITGLEPATTYEVTVQAVDLGGNRSEMSEPLNVTTIV